MKNFAPVVASLIAFAALACGGDPKPTAVPAPAPTSEATPAIPSAKKEQLAVNVDDAILKACNLKVTSADESAKFDFDSDQLSPPEKAVLEQVAKCLTTGPLKGRSVDLLGRADPRGETEYNMSLGAKRARTAHSFLAGLGVGSDKLFDSSRGALDATGTDESSWQKDRRVDVKLRGN